MGSAALAHSTFHNSFIPKSFLLLFSKKEALSSYPPLLPHRAPRRAAGVVGAGPAGSCGFDGFGGAEGGDGLEVVAHGGEAGGDAWGEGGWFGEEDVGLVLHMDAGGADGLADRHFVIDHIDQGLQHDGDDA